MINKKLDFFDDIVLEIFLALGILLVIAIIFAIYKDYQGIKKCEANNGFYVATQSTHICLKNELLQ